MPFAQTVTGCPTRSKRTLNLSLTGLTMSNLEIDDYQTAVARLARIVETQRDDMTEAEDLLLEIANSALEKNFIDPAEHANWAVDEARKYFLAKGQNAKHR